MPAVAVFFDIGRTLALPRISPANELEGLAVYPYIPDVLDELRGDGHRLGIISNTGEATAERMQQVLDEAGLSRFFEAELLIYSSVVGREKNAPDIFRLAAERAGYAASPEQCVYIGEDSLERAYALEAGLRVAPHALLVMDVIAGNVLRYARLTAPAQQPQAEWLQTLRRLHVIPVYRTGDGGTTIYAVGSHGTVAQLANALFDIQLLGSGNAPLHTDLFLLRDDVAARTGSFSLEGQSHTLLARGDASEVVLSTSAEGLLVALPAGQSIEAYHFAQTYHGHTLKLLPNPALLEPFGMEPGARAAAWLAPAVSAAAEPVLTDDELVHLHGLTAELLGTHLDRYTGVQPLDPDGAIQSRHIHNIDNWRATRALAHDLMRIGDHRFKVRYHSFVHEGRLLYNVEAELPGEVSDECVLVTAHLDSTAAFSPNYDSKTDPAPGTDDDASGVAGVLSIASILNQLSQGKQPKRSIRFVLFNAEEHGLIGSKAYAQDQALFGIPITAVYQMDMIGYNVKPPRSFEVHVGYRQSADVQQRSRLLADRISRFVTQLAPQLESPQIYPGPDGQDPAAGRSDHASFHEHGYAACAVSEDFFVGPASDSPEPEANPNYHQQTDTVVDKEYAADIARVVAAAVWVSAHL